MTKIILWFDTPHLSIRILFLWFLVWLKRSIAIDDFSIVFYPYLYIFNDPFRVFSVSLIVILSSTYWSEFLSLYFIRASWLLWSLKFFLFRSFVSCEIHMRIYHWQSCCSDSFKIAFTKSRSRSYNIIKIHIIIVIRKWIIFWNLIFHATIWISIIPRVWYLWFIEFAGLMTPFYIDLQSSISNHSLYLDRIFADILWFNVTNLRIWYIYIYDLFDQVITLYFFKKNSSGIDFQIVSSTLIFILQVWIVNLFFQSYIIIFWWLNIISGL